MTRHDFIALLDETRIAFEKSGIKAYSNEKDKVWHYSVCATPLKPDRLLLIGFNWGARTGEKYEPQLDMPEKGFMEMANKDLGSFKRVKRYLKQYCPGDLNEVGQSNFCFFRSEKDGQISAKDLELSTPLFEKLLQLAPPKAILGFSSRLRDHLLASDGFRVKSQEELPYERGGKAFRCKVVKGELQVDEQRIPVSLLPHPNSPLPGAVREQAWAFCFG